MLGWTNIHIRRHTRLHTHLYKNICQYVCTYIFKHHCMYTLTNTFRYYIWNWSLLNQPKYFKKRQYLSFPPKKFTIKV